MRIINIQPGTVSIQLEHSESILIAEACGSYQAGTADQKILSETLAAAFQALSVASVALSSVPVDLGEEIEAELQKAGALSFFSLLIAGRKS